MIRVIFLKKEISKNFKIARENLQLISHPRKSVSGTTVNLGSLHPKLDGILLKPIFGLISVFLSTMSNIYDSVIHHSQMLSFIKNCSTDTNLNKKSLIQPIFRVEDCDSVFF